MSRRLSLWAQSDGTAVPGGEGRTVRAASYFYEGSGLPAEPRPQPNLRANGSEGLPARHHRSWGGGRPRPRLSSRQNPQEAPDKTPATPRPAASAWRLETAHSRRRPPA